MAQVRELVERLGEEEALDPVAKKIAGAVSEVNPPGRPLKDVLSGTWLGHPLHPLLTDVTIGAWTSAFILDLFGGKQARGAADTLVAVGLVSALPTAASGLSDWSDMLGVERRIGLVHAAANATAVSLYGLSLMARRQGRRASGVALGLLGASVATVGGYLGGHLSYRRGVNVDRNAWKHPSGEWTAVADFAALEDGKPQVVQAEGEDVFVVRRGERVHAIANTCGHAGGPLHEGHLEGDQVACPWHGSVFSITDGKVVHGPATGNQPTYEARITDGKVEVRAASRSS